MVTRIFSLLVGLLIATDLYAAEGDLKVNRDLIVNGKLGVGSAPNDYDAFGKVVEIKGTGSSALYLTDSNTNERLTLGHTSSQDYFYSHANIPQVFYTNGIERMRISSNGDISIGTSNQLSSLKVQGRAHIQTNGTSQIDGFSVGTNYDGGAVGGEGRMKFWYNSNGPIGYIDVKQAGTAYSSSILSLLPNGGNVGIGTTTPGAKLDVAGDTFISGNVSIGRQNLSYKFYVIGDSYFDGRAYSYYGYWSGSDASYKENISDIASPLDKVLKMRGTTYNWKTSEFKDKKFPEGKHHGVIAQEMEQVLPEAVHTDMNGEKAVAYNEIIPVLIEAIKEQQKVIEELKLAVQNLTQVK